MTIISDHPTLSADDLPACRFGVAGCSVDHDIDLHGLGALCMVLVDVLPQISDDRRIVVEVQVFTDTTQRVPMVAAGLTVKPSRPGHGYRQAHMFEVSPVNARRMAASILRAADMAERAVTR